MKYIIFLIFNLVILASNIENFFNQYQRAVTVIDFTKEFFIGDYINNFQDTSCFLSFSKKFSRKYTRNCLFACNSIYNKDIKLISQCEYFDMAIISQGSGGIEFNFDCYCDLGDYLLIKCDFETLELENFLLKKSKNFKIFFDFLSRKNILVIKTDRSKILINRHIFWGHQENTTKSRIEKTHKVESSFTKKFIIKNSFNQEIKSEWVPGINLLTYIYLGPFIPSISFLLEKIYKKINVIHQDWGPSNMIMSGENIIFIDEEDFHYSEKPNIKKILKSNKKKFKGIRRLMNASQGKKGKLFWYDYNLIGI